MSDEKRIILIEQAKTLTKDDFNELGIKQLLSAQRRNGLGSLIDTINNKLLTLV